LSLSKIISRLKDAFYIDPIPEDPAQLFFYCTFSLIGKLVMADGELSDEEVSAVDRFIEDAFPENNTEQARFRKIFKVATKDATSFDVHAKIFFEAFGSSIQARDLVIDILIQVSVADNDFSMEEETMVWQIADIFKLERSHYNRLKFRYASVGAMGGNDSFYALLGCTRDDDNQTVKTRYEELLNIYNPDASVASGVPEAFRTYCEYRAERLEQAFKVVMDERG